MTGLEIELTYYDVSVKHVSHNATVTPFTETPFTMNLIYSIANE